MWSSDSFGVGVEEVKRCVTVLTENDLKEFAVLRRGISCVGISMGPPVCDLCALPCVNKQSLVNKQGQCLLFATYRSPCQKDKAKAMPFPTPLCSAVPSTLGTPEGGVCPGLASPGCATNLAASSSSCSLGAVWQRAFCCCASLLLMSSSAGSRHPVA